jgi:tetratricopeptide (TPR) repeat protein
MSFALNYYFGELNTFGYHLVNVIIHILNGLTLFLLSYTILILPSNKGKERENALKIAFLGSLIWLVHPIQIQAVSYIVQRLTSLSALFFLLSLLCYIKGRVNQAHRRLVLFILSFLFGVLALGTKQNAATLPFFIILSEFFFFQPQPFKMEKKKLSFLLLFAGLFILISGIYLGSDFISRMAQLYEMRGWTPLERVLTQLRVVIFYLSLLIYPHPSRLNLDYDFPISHSLFSPVTTFLSLLAIIGLIALAIFLIKRNRLVSYALFWFFGNLVIESSIIPLEMVFEHRLYLPSMFLIMLVLALFFSLPRRRWEKWITGSIILLILLFSYWTYERDFVWQGQISIWVDASKKSPNKVRPHYNLGEAYAEEGKLDDAIVEYKKAIAVDPNHKRIYDVHYDLGNAYGKKGRLDDAISEYKKALDINPNYAKAYNNLGYAYVRKGKLDNAISEYKKALAIKPNFAAAHYNLGDVYTKKGRIDEGISEHKKALVINPNFAKAHAKLGNACFKKGMLDEAISEYKKALSINSNLEEAHNNLGLVYLKKGMLNDAISEYKKVLAINPNLAVAHSSLGVAYYYKANYKLAIFHYDKAVELGGRVNPKLLELVKPYR